jgi:hypothetical protein
MTFAIKLIVDDVGMAREEVSPYLARRGNPARGNASAAF